MKIAVVSDDGAEVAAHLGRTRGFVIFAIVRGEPVRLAYRRNTFTVHAQGGGNANPPQDRHGPLITALADCDVVIARGMGRRIHGDLMQNGKQVFMTNETDVDRAVRLLARGALTHHPKLTCDHSHPA